MLILRKLKRYMYLRRVRKTIGKPAVLKSFSASGNVIFFGDADSGICRQSLLDMFAGEMKREIDFAGRVLEKKFRFLEHDFNFERENRIIWDYDPVSGKRWGDGFSFDIKYKGVKRLSDIKLPWELAKMQYLFILGKAYWYTGDEKYAAGIIEHISSWIESSPPFKGVHWISGLEIGMRVTSFIMIYPFIKQLAEKEFLDRYLNSIDMQARFIEDNLSISENANNHLIGEAFSLMLCGLFLDSPDSGRRYQLGKDILCREISRQVGKDGVSQEQSLNYHRFFLDYYYLFIILHRQNGLEYPAKIDEIVQQMTEFLLYSLMPDGTVPSFGDADDSRAIYIKTGCMGDNKSILGLGAVLFNRPDFKFAAGGLPEEILWLTGKAGIDKYKAMETEQPSKLCAAFPDAGYYIIRDGWNAESNYLVFDCGHLGGGAANHGHADALSFVLYINGKPLFIDPGTYTYNLDYNWRNYFRSTTAHNTITVDGQDQSVMNDRMSWKTRAAAKCNRWVTDEKYILVEGEHDGYKRLSDKVSHRRIIISNKADGEWGKTASPARTYFLIIDILKAKGKHTYQSRLHLHPDCHIKNINGNKITFSGTEAVLSFISNKEDIAISTHKGALDPVLGWYSARYGSKTETETITVTKTAVGDTKFVMLVTASPDKGFKSC